MVIWQVLKLTAVQIRIPSLMSPLLLSRRIMFEPQPNLQFNWSAHADTQHQVAAARRVLCAGSLRR